MKNSIYIISTSILRFVLRIIPHKPIDANRIVFTSYLGKQYSCNPKYISNYIKKYAPEYKLVWAFQHPEEYLYLQEEGIELVKYNSFKFIQLCRSSKFIITNTRDLTHIPFSSKQCVINTWHGGGAYKKVGSEGINDTTIESFRKSIAQKTPITYISSSKIFTDLTLKNSFHHVGPILEVGMPRNDMLVNAELFDNSTISNKIRAKYSIPKQNKILLYAPTYRKDRKISDYDFNPNKVKAALSSTFGGNWTILFRAHYYVAEELNKFSPEYINVSGYPDMQELLSISDMLITDYSSSIWDFSFTKRPCFLYATDLSDYDLTNGFYTDIFTWPFPLAQNTEELINHFSNYDQKTYEQAVQVHHQTFQSYESGMACEKVFSFIKKYS